ncbi:MAG: glycerophosphodiester phosphodiesterase [Chitinophagaceae bacterium]|nr:MAG: glycerophosphodiester phosphodiesterase [Chitinophagaceae bacterium]
MKKSICLTVFLLFGLTCFAQIKIHSHNDYLQQKPFYIAYANKVDEMEADIFLVGDSILVAHSKRELNSSKTLYNLYLKPISEAFKKYKNKVSEDKKYTFSLMIDVKENWNAVYPSLKKEIEKFDLVFHRGRKKRAIQIVISGARPPHSTFNSYPEWLFFDGLPNITYAKKDLARIAMISDNFSTYSKWKGVGEIPEDDKAKLKKLIDEAHRLNKPIRFWGAPDTQACWQQLAALGADIINTDKIVESKKYFQNEL